MPDNDVTRFTIAQEGVLEEVEAELEAGKKRSHWMWFIFPQLVQLGHSPTARYFGVADLAEARRYLADPILGDRLRRHVRLVLRHQGRTAREILGTPDDAKLRSCLTLFKAAASGPEDARLFQDGLDRFYGGEPDPRTTRLLEG
ncbi:DUF1810 family protein [Paracoccus sp. S-4012]|uniref:DUF1810 domain-containing protein n=1 Tax=Paracoccus sp. S-4012 TaxID=2665648 RepID=UPI0012B145C5|nr:DUF1810 domain-containing protein [Paracoccus sp. S-4012]MRX49568.1 DUF1810 family protein [Paracoccus sp. S-4012]